MATKLLIACLLSLLVSSSLGLRTPRLNEAQQCRIRRLSGTQPSHRIESEGGVIEVWDESEEQFQCAGVATTRIVMRPNSLHLPNYHPSPRLAYVVQGRGFMGVTLPGCAETFTSQQQQGQQQQQQQEEQRQGDHHQKIHRIQRGDVIAIPAGATHWCMNEEEQEELVVITVNDLNHLSNQLDQRNRVFYLAGEVSRGGRQRQQHGREEERHQRGERGESREREQRGREQERQPSYGGGEGQRYGQQNQQNILRAFNTELLSEAFNVPSEIVRSLQREDERGVIVRLEHRMRSLVRPGEEQERGRGRQEEEEEEGGRYGSQYAANGLEETICSMRLHLNVDQRKHVDVFSRQGGKITMVDKLKLPILQHMDMSLEKGNLQPNALISPHWSINSHSVLYVINGDAQVQVVNHEGQNVMNDRVNEGDMVVIPQHFVSTIRAGNNGFRFVKVKTSGTPFKSTLAGYTSVIRAMPLHVVRESYQLQSEQAEQLKYNRGSESLVLSPSRRSRGRGSYD